MLRSMLCGQRTTGSKFTSVMKANLLGPNGKHNVRHQTVERLNPKCVNKLVKGGGGSEGFRGCFLQQKRPLIPL